MKNTVDKKNSLFVKLKKRLFGQDKSVDEIVIDQPNEKATADEPGDCNILASGKNASYVREIFPKGEVVLKLENVTKRYGKRTSVDNVSLEVRSGEVFGFLGPNGAGKTTTIRMICGLHSITEGEITVCGKSIKGQFQEAVRNIGGIIENPEMYKYMSGWDNLKYFASLYGKITDSQIMNAVELVRMQNRIHEKVKGYSLGMRQRVGIAQSLLHNPRLLILDEPTNGLDPAGIHEMRDFLKKLAHEYGIAIFISSHILSEMQLMCDRVAIISLGKLVAVKTIAEWMGAVGNELKLNLVTDNAIKAKTVLEGELGCEILENGSLLQLNTTRDDASKISKILAKNKIAVLSMSQGEKTLEETFLDLTASSGTEIL